MSEKTVVITESDGTYRIENNGISEFALLGILECIVFDLKTARRQTPPLPTEQKETVAEIKALGGESVEEAKQESAQTSKTPELRTRIKNAVKAIKALGGNVEEGTLDNLTNEELQAELEELTEQYKRLKSSKTPGK